MIVDCHQHGKGLLDLKISPSTSSDTGEKAFNIFLATFAATGYV